VLCQVAPKIIVAATAVVAPRAGLCWTSSLLRLSDCDLSAEDGSRTLVLICHVWFIPRTLFSRSSLKELSDHLDPDTEVLLLKSRDIGLE